MHIENRKRVKIIKRVFYIVSALIMITVLVFFLLDNWLVALILLGVFSLWFLYFHVADYHYIEYSDTDRKVLLRYYKAIKLGKPRYYSIEFPQEILLKYIFEDSVFGKMSDLTLLVKTSKGVAEYPTLSLSALSFSDRERLKTSLQQITGR